MSHIENNDFKWDLRFLRLAREISTWSKDPSTQLGAVAVGDQHRILATGYNGFPKGIEDSPVRLNVREEKYKFVVHAEMNCIYHATHSGVSLNGATMYIYGLPMCAECAKGAIQVGINRVVMHSPKGVPTNWEESFEQTKRMFYEANVRYNMIKVIDE